MDIAEKLTDTCHQSYNHTVVKLGRAKFGFTDSIELKKLCFSVDNYKLQPGVESYYILWKLTKDNKCREWESAQYLYLLFSDNKLISLDEWVFNTTRHPLPIKGSQSILQTGLAKKNIILSFSKLQKYKYTYMTVLAICIHNLGYDIGCCNAKKQTV